ncbi:MAG: hypothetical protein HYV07_27245 [Deltaproteobacteria bacterium]|nr:hypothetical protein [Deltaproteobacteria bacterium]
MYLGQALHTLQDSFTHTYRTRDHRRITVVLNWVEIVSGSLRESRDGPPHASELDHCKPGDDFLDSRRAAATVASGELIEAALAPGLSLDERKARVDAVLDRHVTFEPGCDFITRWCDAPERQFQDLDGCHCSSTSARSFEGVLALLAALVFLRRRSWMLALVLVLAAGQASAAQPPASSRLGFDASVGGAIDSGAVAISGGARYSVEDWMFGLDVELNPWISLDAMRAILGTLNVYGTVVKRWYVGSDDVHLRTTGHIGTSVLLVDLVGARKGNVGLFLGTSLIGVEIELGPSWTLIVDPADVAIPVPQLSGAPLSYRQYRVTVGIQFN